MQTDYIPKLLLAVREACVALGGICPRTLWALTKPRGNIPCVKVGNRTMYAVDDLRAWIETQKAV